MFEWGDGLFEVRRGIDEPVFVFIGIDDGEAGGGTGGEGGVCAVGAGASGLGESAILGDAEEPGVHGWKFTGLITDQR